MVKVYFENNNKTELAVIFNDEKTYSCCIKSLIDNQGDKTIKVRTSIDNSIGLGQLKPVSADTPEKESKQSAINDIVLQNIQALESQKIEAEEKVTKYEELLNTFKSQFIDADNTLWVKMIESVGI